MVEVACAEGNDSLLGVHYPSDVVAGSALGAVVALAVRRATRRRPTSEGRR